MMAHRTLPRRLLAATAAGLCFAMLAAHANAGWRPPAGGLAHVEIYDRITGTALPVHEKDGRHYVVGQPGHEYAIRVLNRSSGRILAVTSVDGVNVVTGDTASPEQSGYVIDGGGSVEIAGWRKSLSQTAAFFFTEHSNSYAARTGRPFDVGVIGVAVFAEQTRREVSRFGEPLLGKRDDSAPGAAAPRSPENQSSAEEEARDAMGAMARERSAPAARPLANLGTGHGRNEVSHVRQVAFQRATSHPAQVVSIQYDRRENLVALGILPPPHVAGHSPRPFPAMRFVADPR